MTELDTLMPDRLRHLAEEQAPLPDLVAHADSARGRYRRQRRTRVVVTGLAAAVAAIVVGVPVAMQSLASPAAHDVASTTVTTAPSEEAATDTAPAPQATAPTTAAPTTAAEPAQEAPADPAEAELAEAVALLDAPVAFDGPPLDVACWDLEQGSLTEEIGAPFAGGVGETLTTNLSGCYFPTVTDPQARGGHGLDVSVGNVPGASVAQTLRLTDPQSICPAAEIASVPAGAVLQRCTFAGPTDWWMHVPGPDNSSWVLMVRVWPDWTGVSGPEAMARLANFVSSTW